MKRLNIISFIICSSIFLVSCMSDVPTDNLGIASNEHNIVGIDISKYQGEVNFEKVKAAGISYIFIRATDGITYQDPNFNKNFAAARNAGITIGAYHFYETNDDPADQLKNFTSLVTLKPGDLPPVIDIERLHKKDDIKLTENLQKFLDGLEKHYGVKPIIYTGLRFSNKHLIGFGNYPLWLAEYERDKPKLPNGWSKWTFWQWSQLHTISGIGGDVDADRYNGDKASFLSMLIK